MSKGWLFVNIYTLQGIHISPQKRHFEDDFPIPNVGYVSRRVVDTCWELLVCGFRVSRRGRSAVFLSHKEFPLLWKKPWQL